MTFCTNQFFKTHKDTYAILLMIFRWSEDYDLYKIYKKMHRFFIKFIRNNHTIPYIINIDPSNQNNKSRTCFL